MLLRALSLLVVVLSAGCVGVSVERPVAAPDRVPARVTAAQDLGRLSGCGRFDWDDRRRRASCEITYENDTQQSFVEVDIWCRAFDEQGYQVGARRIHLDEAEVGPMEPGWKLRRRVVVAVPIGSVARIACELVAGR